MSFVSQFFESDSAQLPDWLRQGAAIVDEGLSIYDRIAGDGEPPPTQPMRTAAPPTISPVALTGIVPLLLVAAGAYVLLGMSRRR